MLSDDLHAEMVMNTTGDGKKYLKVLIVWLIRKLVVPWHWVRTKKFSYGFILLMQSNAQYEHGLIGARQYSSSLLIHM
jgi:hypothetical protein